VACGCASVCDCLLSGIDGVAITGSGAAADPYVISPPPETIFDATTDGSIDITPSGPYGHEPHIDVKIDPASTAPVSISAAGLRVDCCGGVGGSNTSTVSTDYDAVQGIDHVILVDSTGGPVTVTLPSPPTLGEEYVVMDKFGQSDTNNITVVGDGGELLNGAASKVYSTAFESFTFRSDGVDWFII
jgi:hypothetical protein